MTTLHIRLRPLCEGKYPVTLTLKRPGQAELEAEANIEFALTPDEREELRWYMEDYLTRPESVQAVQVEQVEGWMKQRGEELYAKILAANMGSRWATGRTITSARPLAPCAGLRSGRPTRFQAL